MRSSKSGLVKLALGAAAALGFAASAGAGRLGAYGPNLSSCDAPAPSWSENALCALLTTAPWLPARHVLQAALLSLPGCILLGAIICLLLRWRADKETEHHGKGALLPWTFVACGGLVLTPAAAALVLRPTPRTWSMVGLAVVQLVMLRRLVPVAAAFARHRGHTPWLDALGLCLGLGLAALTPDRVTLGALAVIVVSAVLAAGKHLRPLRWVTLLLVGLALLLGSDLCQSMGLQCLDANPDGAPLTGGAAGAPAQIAFALAHGLFPLCLFLVPLLWESALPPPENLERKRWTFASWLLLLGLPLDAARLLSAAQEDGAGAHLIFAPAWLAVCVAGARSMRRITKAPVLLMLLLALLVLRDLATDAGVWSRAHGLGQLGDAYPTLRWFHAGLLALWVILLLVRWGLEHAPKADAAAVTLHKDPVWPVKQERWRPLLAFAVRASMAMVCIGALAVGLVRFSVNTARRSPLSALAQAQALRGARPLAWRAPAPLPERLLTQEGVTLLPAARATWLAQHPSGILLTERATYGTLDKALVLLTRDCADSDNGKTSPQCAPPASLHFRSLVGGRFILASAGSLPESRRPLADARDIYRRGPTQPLMLRFGGSLMLRGVDVHLPGNGTLVVTPHLSRLGPVARKVNVVIDLRSDAQAGATDLRVQANPGSPWLGFEHWPEHTGHAHPVSLRLTTHWRTPNLTVRPLDDEPPMPESAASTVLGTLFISFVDEDGPLPWHGIGDKPLIVHPTRTQAESPAHATQVPIAQLIAQKPARDMH